MNYDISNIIYDIRYKLGYKYEFWYKYDIWNKI